MNGYPIHRHASLADASQQQADFSFVQRNKRNRPPDNHISSLLSAKRVRWREDPACPRSSTPDYAARKPVFSENHRRAVSLDDLPVGKFVAKFASPSFFSSVSLVQDVAQEHMRNMRSCLIELCKQLEWLRSLCSDLLHFVRVNEQLLREMELLGLSQLQAVQDQRRDLYESFHIRCDSLTLSTLTSFLI